MASTLFSFKFETSTMVFTIRIHEWIVEKCSVILKSIWTIASRLPLNNIVVMHINWTKTFAFDSNNPAQLTYSSVQVVPVFNVSAISTYHEIGLVRIFHSISLNRPQIALLYASSIFITITITITYPTFLSILRLLPFSIRFDSAKMPHFTFPKWKPKRNVKWIEFFKKPKLIAQLDWFSFQLYSLWMKQLNS